MAKQLTELKKNNVWLTEIYRQVLQQWTLDHAGQELPQAPVDVIADLLTNWGEISASTIKQEATALYRAW